MGNAASDVTSGVKKQAEADTTSQKLYQLVDLKGNVTTLFTFPTVLNAINITNPSIYYTSMYHV